MNKKGQALVEFVLILPIFLFLMLIIYDFGMIFNSKNKLENTSSDIINLFKNEENIDKIREMYSNYEIVVTNDFEYYGILVKTSVNLVTPGLNRIFGDPYIIEVKRYVPYA